MNIDTGRDFFDIDVADLNKDGTYELLVSWAAEFNGSFVAYEIPEDFRLVPYTSFYVFCIDFISLLINICRHILLYVL